MNSIVEQSFYSLPKKHYVFQAVPKIVFLFKTGFKASSAGLHFSVGWMSFFHPKPFFQFSKTAHAADKKIGETVKN